MSTNDLPSGRFLLRIAPALHARLAGSAQARGVSLNEYCARSLARGEATAPGPWDEVVAKAVAQLGPGVVGVAVFGSFARGGARPDSDIDVLVVTAAAVSIERALYRPWDAADLRVAGLVVEPHFARLPSADDPVSGFWAEIALDGAVIHDPELTLSRTLVRIRRAVLAGDLVRRSDLARDYVARAEIRLRALAVLYEAASWADVVREAQEIVELTLKGLLRSCGVSPPRMHDVSDVLLTERDRLPDALQPHVDTMVRVSRRMRRDRELAFYGAEDLTPSGFYSEDDARTARDDATALVQLVAPHVE
ncbi:MAG: HEPN domain-containing protein [Gemmatimonadota bacterium]